MVIIFDEGVYVFEVLLCYNCVYIGYVLVIGVLWLVVFVECSWFFEVFFSSNGLGISKFCVELNELLCDEWLVWFW